MGPFFKAGRYEDIVIRGPEPSDIQYLAPGLVGTDPVTFLSSDTVMKQRIAKEIQNRLDEHEDKLDALKKLLMAALDLPEGVVSGSAG